MIDINCDMGEGFGAYVLTADDEIIRHVSSANIACGFHAGDPSTMRKTVELARDYGVGAGAHPGFPDLLGFGRRSMSATPAEVRDYLIYQIGALMGFCAASGGRLQHVKAHGALYNMAAKDPTLARAMAEAVAAVDRNLIFVALAGSALVEAGRKAGLRVAREGFADRAYNVDGTLVPRGKPGAVIEDAARVAARVVRLATEGKVTAVDGTEIALQVDTICVHGDTPGAVEMANSIRLALSRAGVQVAQMSRLV